MNFTTTKSLFWILFIALLAWSGELAAKCSISASQTSGCQGFSLDVEDVTPGAGNTASWVITLPAGSNPATITCANYHQCSALMNTPGVASVTMTDTVNGTPCSTSLSNIQVYASPVIKGDLSTTVTCVGACV